MMTCRRIRKDHWQPWKEMSTSTDWQHVLVHNIDQLEVVGPKARHLLPVLGVLDRLLSLSAAVPARPLDAAVLGERQGRIPGASLEEFLLHKLVD